MIAEASHADSKQVQRLLRLYHLYRLSIGVTLVLLISSNMVRHDELDFLDDITLEQASAALGVPIYPVDADGFALCDAMFGILPEVHLPDRGSGSTDGAEYYKYNPHKEG